MVPDLRIIIFAVIVMAIASTKLLAQSLTPDAILSRAEDHYSHGNFPAAQNELNLLSPTQQLNNAERGRFYLLMARLDFVFNKGGTARQWLEKLYTAQPTAKLDPVADPPEALAIWEQIKSKDNSKRSLEASKTPISSGATNNATTPSAGAKPGSHMAWYYAILGIPATVAIFSQSRDARFVAMGFLAGALSTQLWNNHSEQNISAKITTNSDRAVLGLLTYSY